MRIHRVNATDAIQSNEDAGQKEGLGGLFPVVHRVNIEVPTEVRPIAPS